VGPSSEAIIPDALAENIHRNNRLEA